MVFSVVYCNGNIDCLRNLFRLNAAATTTTTTTKTGVDNNDGGDRNIRDGIGWGQY